MLDYLVKHRSSSFRQCILCSWKNGCIVLCFISAQGSTIPSQSRTKVRKCLKMIKLNTSKHVTKYAYWQKYVDIQQHR